MTTPADDTDSWLADLATALDIDPATIDSVVRTALLDLVRDVAHGIARPAAPLSAFVVGYAAGRRAGDRDVVVSITSTAADLARQRTQSSPA